MWSSASSNELRMPLPITAVGPLKVETTPILMESAATAGFASASAVAPASQNAVLIFSPPPRYIKCPASQVICPSRAVLATAFSGDVFCARNPRPAASMNHQNPLEPSAHASVTLHHSS